MTEEYLTTEELAARIQVRRPNHPRKAEGQCFAQGVHYIRPFGGRKILFVWGQIARDMGKPSIANVGIPMANGGVLHG